MSSSDQQGEGPSPVPQPQPANASKQLFICDECRRHCASIRALARHREAMHGVKSLPCPVTGCNTCFNTVLQLQSHLDSHTAAEPYTCSFKCGLAFYSQLRCDQHEQKVHRNNNGRPQPLEKNVVCTQPGCSHRFPNVKRMMRHILEVHPHAYPQLKCTFGLCMRRFYTQEELDVHMRRHVKDKPTLIICEDPDCGMTFTQRCNLYRHYQRKHPEIEQRRIAKRHKAAGTVTPAPAAAATRSSPAPAAAINTNPEDDRDDSLSEDFVSQAVELAAEEEKSEEESAEQAAEEAVEEEELF